MGTINRKFYNDEVEYSDGSIEDEILEMVKNTDDVESILREDLRWPVFYHLSYLRENLLNWYPFNKDSNLLEVGAGCGALTGLFCQKVSKVTAVELTDRRSQIIYNRHKDYPNLEIFPGNLNNMEFEEKFDYIILCGVLEYAPQFTQTDNPHVDFLKKIKSMLSDDGVILVAIENRLGLKYFSGSNEDHLARSFVGIDNYPNIDRVRTFSHAELEEVFHEAGFTNYKFFYPYPDYKFPNVIHTEDFVDVLPYLRNAHNLDQEKIKFFNDGPLNLALAKDNISKYFANSFLVELRNSEIFHESENVSYSKLSAIRGEEFRIATQIFKDNGDFSVSKFPLTEKSENHILNMYKHSKKPLGKIKYLESVYEDNTLIYPYLHESNLSNICTDYLLQYSDKNQVIEELRKLYELIKFGSEKTDSYHTEQFSKIFGDKEINEAMYCHDKSNIDLILNNLFYIDNELVAIDYEWCFDFSIPIEYTFFRIINYELTQNLVFRDLFTMEEVFDSLEFNKDWIDVFRDWESNFSNYVNGPSIPRQPIVSGTKLIKEAKRDKKLVKEKNKEIKSLKKEVNKLKKDNSKLKSKVKLMEKSTSWKVTSPLRKVMRKIK